MPMPDRNVEGDYRYACQGQEKDAETGKEAFQLRLWDSRIGRWLTTDPYGEFISPYLGMGNDPVFFIDADGGRISPKTPADKPMLDILVAKLKISHPQLYKHLNELDFDIYISFVPSLIDKGVNLDGLTTVIRSQTGNLPLQITNLRTSVIPNLRGYRTDIKSFNFVNKTNYDVSPPLFGELATKDIILGSNLVFQEAIDAGQELIGFKSIDIQLDSEPGNNAKKGSS